VENTFLHLKRWRGIATRYAKNSASFFAAIQIRCIALWLKISWLYYLGVNYSCYARFNGCTGNDRGHRIL
jgi:hypothetical protein